MKKILLFLLTFLACTYSAQAEDWLYLMGIDGWTNDASASYLFKYNNGTYTLLVEDGSKLSGKQFKLGNSEYGGKWFGYNDATVNLENTQDAYPDNGNMKFGTISGPVILTAYHYSWSDSEKKVSFALSEADDLYLRGDWNSYGTTQKFERSGYVYTLTGVDASTIKGKSWQIASGKWKTKFGGSVNGVGTFDLTYGTNTAFASDFPDGTYDLTFDFSTLKLTVAAHSETPTYQTLYLRGFNSWDVDKCLKFDNAEGTSEIYTLTIDYTTGSNIEWKIANSDYSYQYGASEAIAAAGEYTLTKGPQKGFSSSLASGTYDLEYNYNTHVLKVTKQGTTPDPDPEYPEKIYYYYSSSSKMLEIAAKDQANGVYEATLTIAENASFRFYSNSNKADAYSYGPNTPVDGSGNNYEAYTLGEKRGMTLTSTNRWQLTNTAGEYTFTVDLKNKTFTVVAKSDTPTEYTKYYLRGEQNDWGTTQMFSTTDGITYTLSEVDIQYGTKFKIGTGEDEGWTGFGWGSGSETREIWVGEPEYDIYIKTGDYAANDLKFGGVIDRKVNITFRLDETDTNKAYIKIENADGAVVTYPDLWLRGGFNNWGNDGPEKNTAYKFTCTEGVYTLTVEAGTLTDKYFKIGSGETSGKWTIGFGGSATEGVTAKIGEAFTVYDVDGGKDIYIAENSYKFDIKFVPDFANKTGELTISINNPSGIDDVEISNEAPVEFYNLQGVRVDGELTPGLYIRRQGNNASKVLIR